MTVITIGRNPNSNIVINDNMVSRSHAILKISSTGKYEIVSMGPNGTTVNGNPISPNQPYPLKRGDMVVFAGVARLDWNKVPNPLKPLMIGAIVAGAIALVIIAVLIINNFRSSSHVYEGGSTPVEFVNNDSVDNKDKVKVEDASTEDNVNADETGAASAEELVDFDDRFAEDLKALQKDKGDKAKADDSNKKGKGKADTKKSDGKVKKSEAAPEETKAKEPKAEEPKAEKAKTEEPKAEEPKAEEPAKAEEPKAEEPAKADIPAIRM